MHLSDPEQLTPPPGKPEQRPGVWRVTITALDRDASAAQSLPFAPWDGGDWIVTPILTLLRSQGYQVEIHEGYVWEESHGVFNRWGETLWAAGFAGAS